MHTIESVNHIHIFIGYFCLLFCIAFIGIGILCASMYYEIFNLPASE